MSPKNYTLLRKAGDKELFLCYNINTEQKFEEEYIMKNENCQEFLQLIKQLNQEELGNLIDYALELKRDEIK